MPKDELDAVSDLRYSWKKLHKLATEVSDGLAKMQVGDVDTQHSTAQRARSHGQIDGRASAGQARNSMFASLSMQHHACGPAGGTMQSLNPPCWHQSWLNLVIASERPGISSRTCLDSLIIYLGLQVGFKKTLTKEVTAFATDAKAFRADWQANGPMVPGLAPLEAVERLKKFQQMFDVSALPTAARPWGGEQDRHRRGPKRGK